MKKLIIVLISFIFFQTSFSQVTSGSFRQTTAPLNMQECKFDGSNNGNVEAIPSNAKFTVVNIIPNAGAQSDYVINLWDWEPSSSNYSKLNYLVSGTIKVNRYFKLSENQINNLTKDVVARIQPTAGTLILPIKFRFNPGDFSKDLTFSGTGGIRYNLQRNTEVSFSLIAGIGISSVTVDSLSTDGELSEPTDLAAATALGGLMLEWNFLQIGAFVGADWLARKNENNWIYQGKPWLGVGIGVSLFSKDKAATKISKNPE